MLTWAQIAINAKNFSEEWKGETYEKGESQSFYNEFFAVFGVKRRSVARYEEHIKKLNNKSGFIDLFWPGVLLVEHKSAGRNLILAAEEAGEYFDAIDEDQKPRYQLVCDFQKFELLDRDTGEQVCFTLNNFYKHIHAFSFILGKQKPLYRVLEPINIKASKLVGELYDIFNVLGYDPNYLDQLLVRIVFCLFADNTGIFQPRGIFFDYLDSKSDADGSNLGDLLSNLFQVLNSNLDQRQLHIDVDLAQFPYINGDLFKDIIPIAYCNNEIRKRLIEACGFDWSKISPAIFGSLFQSILSKEERRELGGHFTSENNILKVVDSLFLKSLKNELNEIMSFQVRSRIFSLKNFQDKLSNFNFFDPACGCGNFLAISYREIRRLENIVILELHRLDAIDINLPTLSKVDVDQFFGIEFHNYSARIAENALWMTDHLVNTDLSLQLGIVYQRVPLKAKPTIYVGNALKIDWNNLLPANECDYILGNPPYKGSKIQTDSERESIRVLANIGGHGGTLDYVSGWFIKAGEYAQGKTRIGFVATNSITQGEQAHQLWPLLFDRLGLEISFAHQSFPWITDNPDRAVVHVVIIGLDFQQYTPQNKKLYKYSSFSTSPSFIKCKRISPYLISGDHLSNSHLVVSEINRPINSLNKVVTGTKPIDGGYYIFSEEEKNAFIQKQPKSLKFFRPFIGAREFLYNKKRYILYLPDCQHHEFSKLKEIKKLISNVRLYRLGKINNKANKRKLAKSNSLYNTPRKFHLTVIPESPFLVIPEVTSENRDYVPIGWLEPPIVPSNLLKVMLDASLSDFAFLTSSMHMAWLRVIGGRLENRYRYSIGLVFNNFPIPSTYDKDKINKMASEVLKMRAKYLGSSLEELYDKENMPIDLRKAHLNLDLIIDKSYRVKKFNNNEERISHLFKMYENLL